MQDGRWRAQISLGKKPDGTRFRKVISAQTRHEVRDQLAKTLHDLQLGLTVVSEKQTVAMFLNHWLGQVVKARVRTKTFRTYSDFVKNHIAPALGETPIGKLSPQHVREFLNQKLGAGLSPRSVKHLLVTLRGALAVAVKDDQIPRSVAALVDPPRVPKPEVRAFNPDQAGALFRRPGSLGR
jgi:site-specific recombinase XerC